MWGTTRAPRELGTAGIARLAEAAAHNKLCRMALHFAESIGRDMDFTLRAFGGPQSRISKWRMQRALCWRICTEMRFILCTWFGEFCSCCSLTAPPGPAWVLLIWICKELISSLYLWIRNCENRASWRNQLTIPIPGRLARAISNPLIYSSQYTQRSSGNCVNLMLN